MFVFYPKIQYFTAIFFISLFALCCSSMVTRLNQENFEVLVYSENSPWIVGISSKVSIKELDKIYEETKDRINIGIIDEEEYISYLKLLGKDEKPSSLPAILMYPFGPRIHKRLRSEGVESPDTAVYRALASTPDVTNKLPNVVDNRNTELRNFIQEAYSMLPPKFPLVLFTGDGGVPVFYKQVALKFPTLFHFAVIENAPPATLAVYNIAEVPTLLVLLTELSEDSPPRIRPIPYNKSVHGSMSYPNVMRFLYLVHKQFFNDLLKHSHRSSVTDFDIDDLFEPHFAHFPGLMLPPQHTSTTDYAQRKYSTKSAKVQPKCNSDIDVCILLIGKDLEAIEASFWNDIILRLRDVKNKVIAHGKSIEVHEVDINCNEKLELAFDIYAGDLPVVIILRPKKNLFTIAIIEEMTVKVDQYIEQALSGKIGHAKYKSIPAFTTGKCSKNYTSKDEDYAKEVTKWTK
ncbi:uncharacterized protein LOC135695103 [Rhopilema esculentum]|uniref:uncharacterized protein LOC135695103 n=1 Tax=Rhopilema esculentum TaxID=499914 RepID=UPI0031D6A871